MLVYLHLNVLSILCCCSRCFDNNSFCVIFSVYDFCPSLYWFLCSVCNKISFVMGGNDSWPVYGKCLNMAEAAELCF